MLDNYKNSKFAICVGVIPAALPLLGEQKDPAKDVFSQLMLAMIVLAVTIILNMIILKKRNDIEARFRGRIGPFQLERHISTGGGYMHPALEHIIGVGVMTRQINGHF